MKLNNDIPDKIMERIRKLMRLKESTTSEGEARERPEPTAPRITQAWVTAGTSV